MSAPKTNTERQVQRHRWSLFGAIGLSALASAIIGLLIFWEGTDDANAPRTPDEIVDGRTGEIEETDRPIEAPMPTIGLESDQGREPVRERAVSPSTDLPDVDPTD
ncbi:hypothetical protein [Oceaniglobus roseus]|uniref:hypothetical protein n=1 Tax=Oceaniglobus roseus TaxID=1737570 RepID=UPI000C7F1F63|nr:hypothetical protein [Kandeliimicrobium roseum]